MLLFSVRHYTVLFVVDPCMSRHNPLTCWKVGGRLIKWRIVDRDWQQSLQRVGDYEKKEVPETNTSSYSSFSLLGAPTSI